MSDNTLHKAKIEVDTSDAKAKTEDLASSINQTAESSNQLGEALQKALQDMISATESFGGALKQINEELGKTEDQAKKTGETGEEAMDGIADAVKRIELTSIIQQVQMVTEGLSSITQPAITFEQSMADLAAITGSAGEELEDLTATARKMGAASGLGASESARAFAILAGQIDVPIESLKRLQEQTILLAQAGALPLEEAANALAGTINQFGLEADEAARVTNVLAAGSRAGASEVVDLAESFKVVGAVAAGANVSVEETAGVLEVLASNNIKGAEAGTAMRNVLISMQTVLGIDVAKSGFAGGLKAVKAHVDQIHDPVQRATFLTKAFGRENMTAAQFLLRNIDAVEELTDTVTGTAAAQEQADIRNNTWAHSIDLARAKMEGLQISLVEATGGMLPFMAVASESLIPIAQLSPLISGVGSSIGGMSKLISSSPLGKWGLIIGAVAGALVLLYQNSEEFRAICQQLWGVLQSVAQDLMAALKPAIESLWEAIKGLLPILQNLIAMLGQHIASILQRLAPLFMTLVRAIEPLIPIGIQVVELVVNFVNVALQALMPALDAIMRLINLFAPIMQAWSEMWIELFVDVLTVCCEIVATLLGWLNDLFGAFGGDPDTSKADKQVRSLKEVQDQARETNEEINKVGTGGNQTDDPITLNLSKRLKNALGGDGDGDGGGGGGRKEKPKVLNTTTIEGLKNTISALEERAGKVSFEEAARIQQQIDALQKKLKLEEDIIKVVAKHGVEIEAQARAALGGDDEVAKARFKAEYIEEQNLNLETQEGLANQIRLTQLALSKATGEQAVELQRALNALKEQEEILKYTLEIESKHGKQAADIALAYRAMGGDAAKAFNDYLKKGIDPLKIPAMIDKDNADKEEKKRKKDQKEKEDQEKKRLADRKKAWDAYTKSIKDSVSSIGSIMGDMGKIVGGAAGEWLNWGSTVVSSIGEALPKILELFEANVANAAAGAGSSVSSIPIVGPLMAAGAVASVVAAIANRPKATAFAEGGIVSGTTYAMVGEYPGADNNPELIAPLDRLRELIQPQESAAPQQIELKIRGRALEGVLDKERRRRRY